MDRFKEMYRSKLTTPDQAVKVVESGTMVVLPLGNGEPPALMGALAQRVLAGELRDIHAITGLQVRPSAFYSPEILKHGVEVDSGYVGPVLRWGVNQGLFTYSPSHLSEVSSFCWKAHEKNPCLSIGETTYITVSVFS